ncbi:hypothetical protein HDC90_002307 [Pedobacter sp. AK013]|uniref:hypothetical protein n=1 Tax=Pedobacter sp. AK013 TaxID=2723071 RepID=UPI00160F30C4|nr:hypothetical protein [Pedobacter sp. AK013]MBB6237685.1 hypothetical protein [Pedobacter sp. AK013]
MLISFEPPDISADIMITDNIEAKVKAPFKAEVHQPLLAKHQKLDPARLKEKKILSALELNKLTNVLYNFGSTSTEPYKGLLLPADEGYRCYNPRNAIVFLNEKGIIGEYIEICFECHRNEVSSEEIKMGEFCNEKYKLIKEYFYARGIKYGTGKNVD